MNGNLFTEAMLLYRLMADDIPELGYAEYPEQGAEEGYTYVMIFEASESQEALIRNVVLEVLSTVH